MYYLNEQEYQLAYRFLLLTMTITVIKLDMESVKSGALKLQEPYLTLLENMNKEAHKERRQLREKMKKLKLQVHFVDKNNSFSSFLFISHHLEEQRDYFNPVLKSKVQEVLKEFMIKSLSAFPYSASVKA